jgi:hypothetical protein
MPTRSETMWAVVDRHGHIYSQTIQPWRSWAIRHRVSGGVAEEHTEIMARWKPLRKAGDRAVKVTVTWSEPE